MEGQNARPQVVQEEWSYPAVLPVNNSRNLVSLDEDVWGVQIPMPYRRSHERSLVGWQKTIRDCYKLLL